MRWTAYNCFTVSCVLFVCVMISIPYFVFVPRPLFQTQLVDVYEDQCINSIAVRRVQVTNNITAIFVCGKVAKCVNATCIVPYPVNSTVYVVGTMMGDHAIGSVSAYSLVVCIHCVFVSIVIGVGLFFMWYSLKVCDSREEYDYIGPDSPSESTMLY